MTPEQKQDIRENSVMKPFMFYLDDVTKLEVLKKLKANGIDTAKGSLSALIRVLLRQFAETDSPEWEEVVIAQVQDEYIFTTKKNKRSKL